MLKQNFTRTHWLHLALSTLIILFSIGIGNIVAATTYKLVQVTTTAGLNTTDMYVFEQGGHVMNNSVSSNALQTTTSYSTTGLAGTETYIWKLVSATNGYYLQNKNKASNKYLNNASSTTVSFGSSGSSDWVFTFSDGIALITNSSNSNRFLGYTSASSYAYKAYSQTPATNLSTYAHAIKVYKLVEETSCSNKVALTKGSPSNGTFFLTHFFLTLEAYWTNLGLISEAYRIIPPLIYTMYI